MSVSWIVFYLTERCQLRCRHCLREARSAPVDLAPEIADNVLDQAGRIYRARHVGLTGGEPLLHPRFDDVIDIIGRRGFTWHMVSNGKLFPRLLASLDADPRRRESLSVVNFSLDGATEQTHDAIRGRGSYREVMAAILLARSRSIPFVLQMTVNAINASEIEQFALSASHLGSTRINFGMTTATGTTRDHALRLSAPQWRSVFDRIDRLADTLKVPVIPAEGRYREQPFHECDAFRCESLHIDPKGRLTLCCLLSGMPGGERDVVADLSEVPLVEAHRRLLLLIQEYRLHRLDEIAAGNTGTWDRFNCIPCLRYFGKPHWNDDCADAGSVAP